MNQPKAYHPTTHVRPGFYYLVLAPLRGIRSRVSTVICGVACLLLLGISSCDTPEKALKSTDLDYKKAKAISWYKKKEYFKCIPVLEELIGLMKGRQSTEDLYYMYADANYQQGDYLISAYHFKNFYDLYPNSEKAELCLFMYAKSYLRLSPKSPLDQTYTMKALDAFQLFLNAYPTSKYMADVNESIRLLRKKLEKKALDAAELYYHTSNFKAAATTYINILNKFPDIDEREYVTLMVIKSNYEYAKNSVFAKKAERYDHVIKSFNDFKEKFASSKYLEEGKKFEHDAHYLAVLSAFDLAESGPLELREGYFNTFFAEAKAHMPFITEKKLQDDVTEKIEKGYFLIVKNNFLVGEERKNKEKLPWLEETVKTYYNFVDKYPKSKYLKEAEKMFNISTELLKKLKTNG